MPNDSTRTVLVAIGADLGVALAKVGTAVFTGSSAVAAGAAEALADTANDVFLLIAQRRGSRPADDQGLFQTAAYCAAMLSFWIDFLDVRLRGVAQGIGVTVVRYRRPGGRSWRRPAGWTIDGMISRQPLCIPYSLCSACDLERCQAR